MQTRRFTTFATATLGYTLLVIVWGAFVRITDSGDGCGSHWPTCQGSVIPPSPTAATFIELGHRVTSGPFLGLLVVGQVIWSRYAFARGHLARKAAAISLGFTIVEALIGAGIVLYKKTGRDMSLARGWWMSGHLVNTFFLLASLVLVVWASKRPLGTAISLRGRSMFLLAAGAVAVLITGVTGAIAALGDTLFPSATFAEGVAKDLAPQAHLFLQLRALHPFVAAGTAIHVIVVASALSRRGHDERTRRAAQTVGLLVVTQVALGVINLALAAPIAMQLLHLLAADLLWLGFIVLVADVAAEKFEVSSPESVPASAETAAPELSARKGLPSP